MQFHICYLMVVLFSFSYAQQKKNDSIPFEDTRYKEDQFYIGFTYNFVHNKPSGVSQQGFSGGYQLGFIRDLPVNKNRNLGFGIGLGYATNSYNHNLLSQNIDDELVYSVLDNDDVGYSKNKLNLHAIELPIQFRWRNSTMTSHKFWRVYTGFKLSYVFSSVFKYKGGLGDFKIKNSSDIQRLQTDIDLSFGWNTWNFYLSYGLQPLLKKDARLNGEVIAISPIKFGLFFYVF